MMLGYPIHLYITLFHTRSHSYESVGHWHNDMMAAEARTVGIDR